MSKISEEYRELNQELHVENQNYGTCSLRWLDHIQKLIAKFKTKTLLDYGCGKGLLKHGLHGLNVSVENYDPCIPEFFNHDCHSAELVVCTDVMEHVEPESVNCVLEDLERLTEKNIFFVVSTVVGNKLLPDGSNTHRSVHPGEWWILKISGFFDVFETCLSSRIDEEGKVTSCICILAKKVKKHG